MALGGMACEIYRPASQKERAFNKRTIALNAVIVLLIILLAAMVMSFMVIKDRTKDLNSNLAQYQDTGRKLEEYVGKLEIYEQFEIKVQKKAQLVDSIEDKDVLWSDIIYNLGEAVPPKPV
ncbi:MAG: hypothetical protein U5N58_09635 [Actinomycetota bacterium]|nr:hypothetical protein [Actinomycetota bacterium]